MLRPYVEKLEGRKSQQSLSTLAAIWGLDTSATKEVASSLVEVGFFERRPAEDDVTYWVPFLYRDALSLVQGTEGGSETTDDDESG